MTRLAAIHLAVFCLLLGAIAGSEIVARPATIATSVDPFGECTPEAALDDPATWAGGKGERPAHTCLWPEARPTPELLAEAAGYDLSPKEWGVWLYRWMVWAGESPFLPVPDPTSPVPLPGAMWAAATAIAALAAARRLCRRG